MRGASSWIVVSALVLAGCQQTAGEGAGADAPAVSQADIAKTAADWPALPPLGLTPLALRREGEAVRPAEPLPPEDGASSATIELPAVSGAPFEVRDRQGGKVAIRVTLRDQERVPGIVRGDAVLYAGAYRGSPVVQRAMKDGVEDFIGLDGSLPPAVEYDVQLEGVAGVRLVEDTLEFLTRDGVPRLRMSPPSVLAKGHTVPVHVAVSGCSYDTSPRAPYGRAVTPPASSSCRVRLSWELAPSGYPALLDPTWTTTGNLATGRFSYGMVKLASPALLLACGGYDQTFAVLSSCELYDEVSGSWAATGSLANARANFGMAFATPATPGPRAIAVGGEGPLATGQLIELYDPAAGTWGGAASLPSPRSYATATPLPNNPDIVVIVGGQFDGGGCVARAPTIFHYHFSTNQVTTVANLATGRAVHNATPITTGPAAGSILITGGLGTCCPSCAGALSAAELIAPNGITVSSAGTMIRAGRDQAATFVLPSGQVRVASGVYDDVNSLSWPDSELWTAPSTWNDFKAFPSSHQAGAAGTFGVLANGNLLVAGGHDSTAAGKSSANTFVFDGTTWTADGSLNIARRGMAAGATPSGKIIAVGGAATPGGTLAVYRQTELFDLFPNGTACSGPGLCQSQLCVDGVCCDAACGGACDACNLAGTVGTCTFQPNTFVCRAAASGQLCDVAETCTGSSANCPADGYAPAGTVCRASAGACDVAEVCAGGTPDCPPDAFAAADTVCRASAGACDVPESCGGTGPDCPPDAVAPATTVCRAPVGPCDVAENCDGASVACGSDLLSDAGTVCDTSYVCTGTAAECPSACTGDGDCAPGFHCIGGLCKGAADGGTPCAQDATCASGFCVDGVCCDSACDGACEGCALAGSVGTCTPSPQGSQGDPSCAPYLCDGVATVCPGGCTDSSQCVAGATCVGGQCVHGSGNGAACTADAQCTSGFCTDGVCCNARCAGGCEACDVAGAVGTCTVLGRGETGTCGSFVCDGTGRDCPTQCKDDGDCNPPAFCESATCTNRTRGHVGFSCGGCTSVDGTTLLGLLAGLLLLRRRRFHGEVWR